MKATPGWGWKLRNLIWDNFKSRCCWIFKFADPKANGDVMCKGGCKSCGATINVRVVAGQTMNVEIRNYDVSIAHPRQTCRVSAEGKAYYAEKLENASAHLVHINEANKMMKKGDPVPSHLPTGNALRLIKNRAGSINTNSPFPKDALWSLIELKVITHPTVIREISIYPFCVKYSLPMQKEFYDLATKRKRSVLSLDATGMGLRTASFLPQPRTERKMPVFLYTLGCHSDGKTMPVVQVLSDRHTLSFHVGWLTEWAKTNKTTDEITLDDSAALFGACVQTFTNCHNTNEYVSQCMNSYLFGVPPPKVFIRLDRSHFVKSLHRLDAIKKESKCVRVLVRRVFGVLIVCEGPDVVKKIIQDLFTVIRSEFATSICLQSLENLKDICGKNDPNAAQNEVNGNAAQNEENENDKEMGCTFQQKKNDDSYKNTTSYR